MGIFCAEEAEASHALLEDGSATYSSTIIFSSKQFDEEFHRLDAVIAAAAKSMPGYIGEKIWDNVAFGLVSNVYCWESLTALQGLVQHQTHLQAKADTRSGSMAVNLSSHRCFALTEIPSQAIYLLSP